MKATFLGCRRPKRPPGANELILALIRLAEAFGIFSLLIALLLLFVL